MTHRSKTAADRHQSSTKKLGWWRVNRRWLIFLILVPGSYVGASAGLFYLQKVPESQSNGWALLITALLLIIGLAGPVVFAILALVHGYRAWRTYRVRSGHPNKREQAILNREHAFAAGMQQGKAIRRTLMDRHLPPSIQVWGLIPRMNEVFFLSGSADYSRFYGTTVTYGGSTTVAFGRPAWVAASLIGSAVGNSIARNRAEQLARAQWREFQPLQVLVSNQRIVCNVAGRGWLSFDYGAMTAIYPDPENFSIICEFRSTEPMMLNGPMVPSLANIAVLMTHGHGALTEHPALRAIGE